MTESGPAARSIARHIAESGPITFADFMERALYGNNGYYAAATPVIGGRGGDFITGSRLPLFAAGTQRLLVQLDRILGEPAQLLEVGAGDGRHLAHLAVSGRGPLFAHDRVRRPMPPGVTWVSRLEPESIRGVVMSYELFDALPVHRLVQRDGVLKELFVDRTRGKDAARGFCWVEKDLSDPELEKLIAGVDLIDGQIVDVSGEWSPTCRDLAETLERGVLLTFDYGYPRHVLLDARVRRHGTVACYRRHRVHRDPLIHVGGQDITAHVDFTTLEEASEAAGLKTLGRFKLAEWLTGLGIFDHLQGADLDTREQAQTLLNPVRMGTEIQVLVQAREGVELGDLGRFRSS